LHSLPRSRRCVGNISSLPVASFLWPALATGEDHAQSNLSHRSFMFGHILELLVKIELPLAFSALQVMCSFILEYFKTSVTYTVWRFKNTFVMQTVLPTNSACCPQVYMNVWKYSDLRLASLTFQMFIYNLNPCHIKFHVLDVLINIYLFTQSSQGMPMIIKLIKQKWKCASVYQAVWCISYTPV